jgi:hypothetical protein
MVGSLSARQSKTISSAICEAGPGICKSSNKLLTEGVVHEGSKLLSRLVHEFDLPTHIVATVNASLCTRMKD